MRKCFVLGLFAATAAMAAADPAPIRVQFTSGGQPMVGHLYLPPNLEAGKRVPGVVVTGAWMTVKEQMPTRYARELASRGFAALVFDFRGWGESGGTRRQKENPREKIEDTLASVRFLRTRPEVLPGSVAGLGICASSGYMATAAGRSRDLRAVALVAPWLQDREIVEAVYGGADGVQKLREAARTAESTFRATGKQAMVPAASLTDRSAIMFGVPYYTEANRGMIPAWRNEADPAFWDGWLGFDAMPAAERIRQPMLLVHSDAAAIPQGARKFYGLLKGPKQDLWLEGSSQFDFYDQDKTVTRAADAVAEFFRKHLPATR